MTTTAGELRLPIPKWRGRGCVLIYERQIVEQINAWAHVWNNFVPKFAMGTNFSETLIQISMFL